MKKFVKILFLVLISMKLDLSASPEYLKYVTEIVNEFEEEMKKKYGFRCTSSGGAMPHDVEGISVGFHIRKRPTLDEARKVEVTAIQKLLYLINNHKKIRPFLREYPFKSDRVGVSITYIDNKGDYHFKGAVTRTFTARGRIFYDGAEIRMEKPLLSVDYLKIKDPQDPEQCRRAIEERDKKVEKLPLVPQEYFVPILDESFEEALKKVQENNRAKKGNNTL